MSDGSPIEFTATTSLAELLAAEDAAAPRRPSRKRRLRTPLFILGGMVVGVALSAQGDNDWIGTLKGLLQPRIGLFALASLVTITALIALFGRVMKLVTKTVKRRAYIRSRRLHLAVDASDPALRLARFFRFDETGMTTTTAYDELWESWGRITGFDETPDLLIVRVGGTTIYPLPKAQLSDDLRGRLRTYVDARSSSKWPF